MVTGSRLHVSIPSSRSLVAALSEIAFVQMAETSSERTEIIQMQRAARCLVFFLTKEDGTRLQAYGEDFSALEWGVKGQGE